jgi:hypothetical protein
MAIFIRPDRQVADVGRWAALRLIEGDTRQALAHVPQARKTIDDHT